MNATSSESDFEDIAGTSSTISSLETVERFMSPSPVDPPAPLESPLASSTLSPKSWSSDTSISPTQFPRHERFWFRDGSVIFVVENTSYRLHLYLFELHSTKFVKIFLLDHTDMNEPIVLEGIDKEDFDAFLNVLYRISYTSNPSQSAKAWASVLHLASIWDFPSIRELAIESFEPSATDVDKVVLGHKYGHHEWLLPGYSGLVAREEPLTIEEGTRLGMRDVVDINNAREKIRALSTPPSKIEMTQSLRCPGGHMNNYTFDSTTATIRCIHCSHTINLPSVTTPIPAPPSLPAMSIITDKVKKLIPRSNPVLVSPIRFKPRPTSNLKAWIRPSVTS